MKRVELERYITRTYHVNADYPWAKYPDYAVFRHHASRKWFALLLRIPGEKLQLLTPGQVDVLNIKCDPAMIGALRTEQGIYPAYHMSKTNWVSVLLDERVSDEKIKFLLELSFELTAGKAKKSPQKSGSGNARGKI